MPLEAELLWRDADTRHRERLLVADSAALADGRWARAAEQARATGAAELDPAPWIAPTGLAAVELAADRCRLGAEAIPGRCYPRLAFPNLAQGPRDPRPTRLLDRHVDQLRVDPNHPLAGHEARLILRPGDLEPAPGQRLAALFDGPGLQAPPADPAATYFALDSFRRDDEHPDHDFYAEPRLIQHLDAACRARIATLYGRFLQPGQRLLDLMASWDSHLPETPADLHVAGLGMSATELAANPRLNEVVVKDLNERDDLPWSDARFDVVVCTASIEYLIRPRAVLAEVRRVLRPGGVCVLTFSDRWFPPKAIRLWRLLHPFERLGFVLALLRDAGFHDLHSETLRGLKRPEDDKYIEQRNYADPLFAAWGKAPA
jgi:SAM-dependent methyltransferase